MPELLTRRERSRAEEQSRPSLEPPVPLPNRKALMVGASPPPYHGSIMMFAALMNSSLREQFRLIHLDISDHRDLDNIGRFDPENVRLGLRHAWECWRLLRREQPELVYVPVAMTPLGYLRDAF